MENYNHKLQNFKLYQSSFLTFVETQAKMNFSCRINSLVMLVICVMTLCREIAEINEQPQSFATDLYDANNTIDEHQESGQLGFDNVMQLVFMFVRKYWFLMPIYAACFYFTIEVWNDMSAGYANVQGKTKRVYPTHAY